MKKYLIILTLTFLLTFIIPLEIFPQEPIQCSSEVRLDNEFIYNITKEFKIQNTTYTACNRAELMTARLITLANDSNTDFNKIQINEKDNEISLSLNETILIVFAKDEINDGGINNLKNNIINAVEKYRIKKNPFTILITHFYAFMGAFMLYLMHRLQNKLPISLLKGIGLIRDPSNADYKILLLDMCLTSILGCILIVPLASPITPAQSIIAGLSMTGILTIHTENIRQ